ncbi:MAG: hypothetical protein Kow0027_22600 [Saprospiraceae bacterium]
MHFRYIPFTILLLTSWALQAQVPQNIIIPAGATIHNVSSFAACADQFAGTVHFEDEFGNPVVEDTFFLCFGQILNIVHNGDANLTGDPDPGTQPGITYAILDCPPTVSGPNLSTIITDPCLTTTPPPAMGIWAVSGGSANGNIQFNNSGQIQNFYNGGNPVLKWFAPLTIDRFADKAYEQDPATMEVGPCVNLNVAEAFPVVYLNEIDVSNLSTNTGVSGCQGTFEVVGGLPEFDGSNYDITIELVGSPGVYGYVVNGPYTHNETVTFQVPVPGVYEVIVGDGKGCQHQFFANMASCVNTSQSAQSMTVAPGDNICINITNEGGFIDLVSMQYALNWDDNILQFSSVTNLTPLLPNFTVGGSFNATSDSLFFSWANLAGNGNSLPDGTVLYQVCFDVVGTDGECTDLNFVAPPGPGIEVINEAGSSIGFFGMPGQVCVSNTALVVDFTTDSVSCFNSNDGAFTVTVSGGMAPYSVTWQDDMGGPVQGPATINLNGGSFTVQNLTKGTYTVTVADSNGTPVVASEQVTVPGPPDIEILFNETPPLCNGDPGSVDATIVVDSVIVNNPTAQFDFLWSTNDTGTSISGVLSGVYSLTITDQATGCTVEDNTFLPQPPVLNVLITTDSATCSGIGDGAIHVVVSGGTPDVNGDYTIQWPSIGPAPGLTLQNTISNINGLESDSYPLRVTDSNGCTFEADIWLPARKVLSMDAVIQNISCAGICSGEIAITGVTTSANGQPPSLPYNFDWFGSPPPPPPSTTTATSSTTTNMCAGVYTIVMEDAAGCEIDTSFTLTEPPQVMVEVLEANDASCTPGNDGSIIVGVTGGTYPFNYLWNSITTDSIATGLGAGFYAVTVQDANGCEDSTSATIIQPMPPTITALNNDTLSCPNGSDGMLTVQATPGGAPITLYSWSNSANGPTITNLPVGNYTVTVTDGNNCTAEASAQVVAPAPMVIDSITTVAPQCPGSGGGQITVFVSGGAAPYHFNWSTGLQGVGFNVLGGSTITAGSYTVTITDDNNCEPLVQSITLLDPPSLQVSFSAIDSVSCAGTMAACDGGATATASYSNGNTGLFDFTWQSGESDNDLTSSTAVQLCAGSQFVVVSDGICFDTFTVDIPAPPAIQPGADITNVSCNGGSDGEVTLTPTGGTPPYTITWTGNIVSPTLPNLTAGTYMAVIEDANGCTFNHTITITEPPVLTASINQAGTMDVSCAGENDGIITVEVQGGNLPLGPPSYLWQNGIAPTSSNFAAGLSPGTYSVTVVDIRGCSDTLTHTISEPPSIQFSLGDVTPIQCAGGNTFITVDSVWGGQLSTYQFSVDNGILRVLGTPSPVFAGTHTISIVDVLNGCTVDTVITISEPVPLNVVLPDVLTIELGDTTTVLDPVIVSSLPIDSFLWTPSEELSCSNCKNPTVIPTVTQLYTLTITDVNGCTASDQVLIEIDRNRNVYIPNVFSPNNDGINDIFRVYTGIGVTNINFFRVYDRWGELVFDAKDLAPSADGTIGWDGRFNGEDMDPAVFMYLIEVEFLDGRVLLYRGDVALLR